ncbi:hypothetical protein L6452_35907 [Arctium lappa]|uniref:Uncharacterized protein n=1 Tax=Arctium lappa TaxID=4217 RepID=A0ACB8Y7X2_ARCLA|nr:hypothetical protein L6452_35907 [Arctium lappa]
MIYDIGGIGYKFNNWRFAFQAIFVWMIFLDSSTVCSVQLDPISNSGIYMLDLLFNHFYCAVQHLCIMERYSSASAEPSRVLVKVIVDIRLDLNLELGEWEISVMGWSSILRI